MRRRILRAFVGRGLIERCDAKEMLTYPHSGFSVNAGVCIQAHDRAAQGCCDGFCHTSATGCGADRASRHE